MFGTGSTARSLAVVTVAWVAGAGALSALEERRSVGPQAVSPGGTEVASLAARCAAFSWAGVEGATAYELAVYRLDAAGDVEPASYLARRIEGHALSWTPELEKCPARGERHAWMVRALTIEGATEWSEPLFFSVESGPSEDELRWALEILRRHTERAVGEGANAAVRDEQPRAEAAVETRSPRAIDARGNSVVRASSALTAGRAWAQLKVSGEVRTIDPADDTRSRLWGTGRVAANQIYGEKFLGFELACVNGDVRYGLSAVAVDWGSAAAACPAGTWVCKGTEIGFDEGLVCDTERPDTGSDAVSCRGVSVDVGENQHYGRLADTTYGGNSADALSENGFPLIWETCTTAPVWCCWK